MEIVEDFLHLLLCHSDASILDYDDKVHLLAFKSWIETYFHFDDSFLLKLDSIGKEVEQDLL